MKRGFAPIAIIGCIGCATIFAVLGIGFMTGLGYMVALDGGGSGEIEDKRQDISAEEWTEIFKKAGADLNMPWALAAAVVYSESGGGGNFGGCSYFDPAPGSGWVLSNSQVRGGSYNDREHFKDIANANKLPRNEPISCNAGGANGSQNGGAMGYMQVMPYEWTGAERKVVRGGFYAAPLNPWNAYEAAYVGTQVLRNKARLSNPEDTVSENENEIKLTISKYLGGTNIDRPYVRTVYNRYLEFKAAGKIVL